MAARVIATASQWISIAAGVWPIGLGLFMLIRPRSALAALAQMGGSPTIHFSEMGVRILVGAAMMLAASAARLPLLTSIIGCFLIVSAVALLLLPRRWHAAYSTWWSRRIPVAAVRLLAPVSCLMGGALIWLML